MRPDDAPLLAALSVRPYRAADRAAWDEFVFASPEATFFHRIAWRDVLIDVFKHSPHYLIAERGGKIVGILPLAQVRSWLFGHALVSLPFAVYGGVAVSDEAAVPALHQAAIDLARDLGVDHLELRNREPREAEWPRQELYVTFRKAISADSQANLNAIPRKQRAMVRKSILRGLKSEIDVDAARFFELYSDNVHRHGTPALPRRYFEALLATFGADAEVMTVLDPHGQPVSSVLSFYFRNEVLPYYAGDLPAARELAANDFKYWELMRRAAERGFTVFDYGRSKRGTGSFDFKKNWGFEPSPLAYEFQLFSRDSIPQNNPANPKYRLMIAAWQRMPRGLANALGPWIVRNLG